MQNFASNWINDRCGSKIGNADNYVMDKIQFSDSAVGLIFTTRKSEDWICLAQIPIVLPLPDWLYLRHPLFNPARRRRC